MNIREFLKAYNAESAITTEEMTILDENADDLGVSKSKLMENAGAAVASFMDEMLGKDLSRTHVHVLCGLGNNGGDGFVVARHVSIKAASVHVYLLGRPGRINTPEARQNWQALESCKYSIHRHVIRDSHELPEYLGMVQPESILVDALLGSGVQGTLREPIATAVKGMNALSREHDLPVIVIDTPTGVDPSTGLARNLKVNATAIITFHSNKTGFVNKEEFESKVHVAQIGIPLEASWLVGKGDCKMLFRNRRSPRSTKGMNGKLLIVGGSHLYSGAPSLSALAAMRCGVDLVNICTSSSVASTIRGYSPDLIVTSMEGPFLNPSNLDTIKHRMSWANAVLVGPGAGEMEETRQVLKEACIEATRQKKFLVVDADGLKVVEDIIADIDAPRTVLTPHAGEFSIISGTPGNQLKTLGGKLGAARDFIKGKKLVLLLKGPEDVIIHQHGCKINLTGTPAMTTGGTGDILAGVTAAFLSMHASRDWHVSYCAAAAAHVNGLAGEEVERKVGAPCMTASMMLDVLGEVVARFY